MSTATFAELVTFSEIMKNDQSIRCPPSSSSSSAGSMVPPMPSGPAPLLGAAPSPLTTAVRDTFMNANNNKISSDKTSNVTTAAEFNPQFLPPNICAGCNRKILDRYLLKAVDKVWHETCLRCHSCDCPLQQLGQSFLLKNEKMYCRRDYIRLFGLKGECSVCRMTIPAYDMVMKAGGNVYHLNCFACQACNHRFCVGDTFYFDFDNNKILCKFHYDESLYFASFANNNSNGYHHHRNNNVNHHSLTQLKRKIGQVEDLEIQPLRR